MPSTSVAARLVVWLTVSADAVYRRVKRGVSCTLRLSQPFEPAWDGFCAWRWRWLVFMVSLALWVIAVGASA